MVLFRRGTGVLVDLNVNVDVNVNVNIIADGNTTIKAYQV